MKYLKINSEILSIFENIIKANRDKDQWSAIESSDMYQTEHFSGGFDSTENAFCFSFYYNNHEEY